MSTGLDPTHPRQRSSCTERTDRGCRSEPPSQPALSLSLKRLEDLLKTKLFLRRNRGLTLTPAGQHLLRESNRLLSHWDLIVAETRKSKTEIKGRFSLGCHPSVAIYALKDALKKLYSSSPGIELQLVHGLSRVITEGVISGEIDFGIVVNPVRHPDLVIHPLATDEVCFWRAPQSLKDVLIYNPALTQSQSLLGKIKKRAPFVRSLTSDNLEVIATLAGSGAGTAILPTRVAKVIAPRLKKVVEFPSYFDQVTLIYRADLPKTAASQRIIDWMKRISI